MESRSSDDSSTPSRSELVKFAIETLETRLHMTLGGPLGQGTFGDVYRMRDPDRRSDIAVKIVIPANTIDSESNLWPKLDHPNVLSLLEVLTLNPVGVVVFVTPLMESSLHDVLYEKKFLRGKGAFGKVRQWMYEVLCALEYMAGIGMCHLDVKVDNVLISGKSRAVLCDFSFVNRTDKPLDRYSLGLPHIYRPPEACQSLKEEVRVDGVAYDMWGYGMMSLEILTHFVIATSKQACGNWMEDIYPLLFNTLQDEELGTFVTLAFPADIKEIDLNLASDFLHSFLLTDASKRPFPSFAMKHAFLKHGHEISFTKDEIWINKLQYFKIKTPKPDSRLKRSNTPVTSDRSEDTYPDTSDSESESSNDESLYSDRDITEGLIYSVSDPSSDVPTASNLDLPSVSDWSLEENNPSVKRIRSSPYTPEKSEPNVSPYDHHQNEESCNSVSLVQYLQLGSTKDENRRSLVSLDKEDDNAVNRSRSFPLISDFKRSVYRSCPALIKLSSRENISCKTDRDSYSETIKSNNETNKIVVQMSYGYGDSKLIETSKSNIHGMLLTSNDTEEFSKEDFVSFEVKPDDFLAISVIFKRSSNISIHKLNIAPKDDLDEKYTHIENSMNQNFNIGSVNDIAMSTPESSQLDENGFTEEPIKNNSLLVKETSTKFVSQSFPNLPITEPMETKSSKALKVSESFQTELGNNNACSFSENKLDGKDAKGNEEERLLKLDENRITEPSTKNLKSDEGCSHDNEKRPKEHPARKMMNWFGRRCFPLRCGFKKPSRKT